MPTSINIKESPPLLAEFEKTEFQNAQNQKIIINSKLIADLDLLIQTIKSIDNSNASTVTLEFPLSTKEIQTLHSIASRVPVAKILTLIRFSKDEKTKKILKCFITNTVFNTNWNEVVRAISRTELEEFLSVQDSDPKVANYRNNIPASSTPFIPKAQPIKAQITNNIAQRNIKKIPGDGNCFYVAVADQLQRLNITTRQGENYSHQDSRRIALDYINIDGAFREDLSERLKAGGELKGDLERTATTIDEYTDHHSKNYAWTDSGMIGALCKALDISISSYGADDSVTQLNSFVEGRNISVFFTGNHYDSIIIDARGNSSGAATASELAGPLEQEKSKAFPVKTTVSKPQETIKTAALKYREVMCLSDDLAEAISNYIMFSDTQKVGEVLEQFGIKNPDGSEMRCKSGSTFLYTAACHGKSEIVLKLLAMGASPNAKEIFYGKEIVIGKIIQNCNTEAIMAALEKTKIKSPDGSEVRHYNGGETLLQLALSYRTADEVILKMIEMGAGVYSSSLDFSPIFKMIKFNREATILSALTKMDIKNSDGSDITATANKETLFHFATSYIKPGIVLKLLEMGADPNAKNMLGFLPIHDLIQYWIEEIALSVFETMGQRLTIQNASALLRPAAIYNKAKLFLKLLDMGADPNTPHAPYQSACYEMGRMFEKLGRIDEARLHYQKGIEQETDEVNVQQCRFRDLMIDYAKSGINSDAMSFLELLYNRSEELFKMKFNDLIKELIFPNANEYTLVAVFYDSKNLHQDAMTYYKAAIEHTEGNQSAERTLSNVGLFRIKRAKKEVKNNVIDHDTIKLIVDMIRYNSPNVLSMIEKFGIRNPDGSEIINSLGFTFLHEAATYGQSEIALKLLEMGADPNHRTSDNNQIAIAAIIRNCSKEVILTALKTTNIKNHDGSEVRYYSAIEHSIGHTLLDVAAQSKYGGDEVVLTLLEMGANLNCARMLKIIEQCSQMAIVKVLETVNSKDDNQSDLRRYIDNFFIHAITLRKSDVGVKLLEMGANRAVIESTSIVQIFDHTDALKIFTKILELEPENIEALKGVSYVYVDQKKYDLALAYVKKAAILDPQNAAHHGNIALSLNKLTEFYQAIESAKRSVSIDEKISYAYYQLGYSLYKTQDLIGAVKEYKKSLEIHPSYYKAWHSLGACYFDQKEYEQAIHAYQEAIKHNSPDSFLLYKDIGLCSYMLGKYPEGIAAYKEALARNNGKCDDSNIYYKIGTCYHANNNDSDALEYYKKVLALDPNHMKAMDYLLSALFSLKRYDADNLALVQNILSKNQPNKEALLYCAEYYFQQKDYTTFQEYAQRLIVQDETNFRLHRYVGCSLYRAEKYQEALDYCNKAVILVPQDPILNANLGDVYQKLNRYQDALEQYNRSLELIPDGESQTRFSVSCFKGNLLCQMGKDEEALIVLNDAYQLSLTQNMDDFNDLQRNALEEALSKRLELIEQMQTPASVCGF